MGIITELLVRVSGAVAYTAAIVFYTVKWSWAAGRKQIESPKQEAKE
jgi:phenylpyruvate tautomerase PptA (4-oxalocrotonate tautomerase family)